MVTETTNLATKLYTAGWPEGITLDPVGARYVTTETVKSSLGLGDTNTAGNAQLTFEDGLLTEDVKVRLNIDASKVVKLDAKDKTYALTVTSSTGLFKGTFTPNWAKLASKQPAFLGVILQKGGNKGGFGYFHSNSMTNATPSVVDPNPRAGSVTLDMPDP